MDYDDAGILRIAASEEDRQELLTRQRWQKELGESVTWLSPEECIQMEPHLSPDILGALYFDHDHQVHNIKLAKALVSAIQLQGTTLLEGVHALHLIQQGERIIGVHTDRGDFYADHVVVAGGAWSSHLLEPLEVHLPVFPVKGQSFAVEKRPHPFRRTLFTHGCYMVPKHDGSIIIGATEENAGFDKTVTVDGIASLNEVACRLVPGLRSAALLRSWAGLRPATPDRFPYIGAVDAHPGLWTATGHFRNGILLTPITGEVMADLILGQSPAIDCSLFSPMRFMSRILS
jgi:glycine oxidase